jgi:hypothetical protein
MDSSENSVEISPHGLARQPTKKRYLRKSKVPLNVEEEENRQVRRLDGQQQQQQPRPEEQKLNGAMVDELRLHFDFESLKED